MELYLIRHTTPKVEKGICYGQTDLQLAETYSEELAQLKSHFKSIAINSIYTSPLQRCNQLAIDLFGKNINVDPNLMEINFGAWEQVAWDVIDRALLDEWANDLLYFAPPDAESLQQLSQRVTQFYQQVTAQEAVAIVTHGGVIRCLLCHLLNVPLNDCLAWTIDYGTVSKLTVSNGKVVPGYINSK